MPTVISGKLRPSTSLTGDFHGEQTCSGHFGTVLTLHNCSTGGGGGSSEGRCSGVKWGSRKERRKVGVPWDRTPLVFSRGQCVFLKLLNLNPGFFLILSFFYAKTCTAPVKKRGGKNPSNVSHQKKRACSEFPLTTLDCSRGIPPFVLFFLFPLGCDSLFSFCQSFRRTRQCIVGSWSHKMKEALAMVRGGFGLGVGIGALLFSHCNWSRYDAAVAPRVKFKVPCEIFTTDARRLYNVAFLLCYFPPWFVCQHTIFHASCSFPLHPLHKLLSRTAANKRSLLPIFLFFRLYWLSCESLFSSRRRRCTQRKWRQFVLPEMLSYLLSCQLPTVAGSGA